MEPMRSAAMRVARVRVWRARVDTTLGWRGAPCRSSPGRFGLRTPSFAAARREALCDDTIASAASALLFHRHDVGLRKPRAWDLRRFIDVTFEDPTLLAAQHLPGTGLTRYRQLDTAYRAECVVPWRVVVRAKARALVEMEGASVGSDCTRDGRDGPVRRRRDGALALHLALRSMDPTGETLGSTPLAAVGKRIVTSETVSATAIRTQVRRAKAARAVTRSGEEKSERRKNDDSDDDVEDDDIERMNEDQLSNFNPLVLMRRAHEEDEATHLRTPLESKLASIRRFKPAAPITGDEDPNGRNLWHRACLYLGASAAIRRKRRTHDAERIRRAREVLDLLLDAALGGRGDQLGSARIAATEGAPNARHLRSGTRARYPRAAGGGGRGRFGRAGRRRRDATGGAARARRRRGYPRRFKIRRQVGRRPRVDSQRATPRRGAARERRARSPGRSSPARAGCCTPSCSGGACAGSSFGGSAACARVSPRKTRSPKTSPSRKSRTRKFWRCARWT